MASHTAIWEMESNVNFLVRIIGDYADDVNILGRSVHTIKKNTGALVVASE
jgi:hypothetical protein